MSTIQFDARIIINDHRELFVRLATVEVLGVSQHLFSITK